MAKMYDVYEDFREEMKIISHFFNLEYHEKKFSNEELIFNLLEQQLRSDKKDVIADCVNILQKQNKIPKKTANRTEGKKEFRIKKSESDNKKNQTEDIIEKKIEDDKNKILNSKITKPSENPSIVTFFPEDFKEQKKENKNFQIDFLSKEQLPEKKDKSASQSKTKHVKNDPEKITDEVKDKNNNREKSLDLFSPDKKINPEVQGEKTQVEDKKVEVGEMKVDKKNIEDGVSFKREYFQNGRYVIDGINLSTSVFLKKNTKLNVDEKKCDKEEKKSTAKRSEINSIENKNFKIDCNIEQNLLNGCYWPTQLS